MFVFLMFLFLSNIEELIGKRYKLNSTGMEGRIVGGRPVDITAFPHLVQFINKNNLCGGSILNKNIVLTAAHCFDFNKNIDQMVVQTGARYLLDVNSVAYDVFDFILHEDYNKTRLFSCDIALILLDGSIEYNKKARPARLVNHKRWMRKTERQFYVTGWGWTEYGGPLSQTGLLFTYLRYIPKSTCNKLHGCNLTKDMFCLYGNGIRDACKGDSGGPVTWNEMVVGIVSHGDGCASTDKPSVYANIYYFRQWIRDGISKLKNVFCKNFNTK